MVAERGRPVPRDELAEVLWGETPPATWEKALTVIVSKLRGLLEDAGVARGTALSAAFGCYRLELPEETWVDVVAAADAAQEAEDALAAGDLDRARAAAVLAVRLAGQSFLPGEDGLWVDEKRRELGDVRSRALAALADACLRAGDARGAVRWAEEAIAAEPFREAGYRRLMEAHTAAGNRAEALQVYERCRRLLAEELGTYPSPETASIYRALLDAPPPPPRAEDQSEDVDWRVRPYQVVSPGREGRSPPMRAQRKPGRKRRLGLAVAAAAVAGVGAAVAILGLNRDSGGAIVVPPNSVAVIDPEANDVVAAIPVGESPGPIVAGLGAVWVLNRNDLTISKLNPATRQVVAVLPGVTQLSQFAEASRVALLAAGEGALWTGHATTVRRSDPNSVASARAIELPGFDFWTGIATGRGRVWIAGGEPRLLQIDPERATIAEVTPLDAVDNTYGWSYVAVGLRAVWVAHAGVIDPLRRKAGSGSAVFRYDPVSGDIARLPLDGVPSAMAVGRDAVWVADADADALVRIRPRPIAVVRSIQVGHEPVAVAAGGGAIWTANASDGTVSRVDPGSGEVTTIHVGHRPQGVVVANGLVWVSLRSA